MDSDTETIISYNSDDDNNTIIENTIHTIQTIQTTQPIRNHYLYHLRQGNIHSNEISRYNRENSGKCISTKSTRRQ